jgi:deazaflavin-dependent oxidoreductase (nitroreductase family)
LLYVHEGETLYVIGTIFGAARHPAWTANLLASPIATIAIAGERIPVRATLVDEATTARVLGRFIEIRSAYDAYRRRTSRDLRVFALTRMARA